MNASCVIARDAKLCNALTETLSPAANSNGTITNVAHTIFRKIVSDKPIVCPAVISFARPMISILHPDSIFRSLIASTPTTYSASTVNLAVSAATNARDTSTK